MAYNQTSEYPAGIIRIDALTTTPKVVTAAGSPIRIAGIIVVNNGAAIETVRFRNNAGDVDYFSIAQGLFTTGSYPIRWKIDDLEVVLDSAGDVDVVFFIENSGNVELTEV